jgi:hypothetical protein
MVAQRVALTYGTAPSSQDIGLDVKGGVWSVE